MRYRAFAWFPGLEQPRIFRYRPRFRVAPGQVKTAWYSSVCRNLDVCAGAANFNKVPRTRASTDPRPTPELLLRKATLARTSGTRAKYAARGLAVSPGLDRTTRALLLRQLYLSHMEARSFAEALQIAEQMIQADIMPDVARQDAARACLGLGERERAVEHLRLASRVSPPARRAFHLWTLGSVLYLMRNHREAAGALLRASRWGTTRVSLQHCVPTIFNRHQDAKRIVAA